MSTPSEFIQLVEKNGKKNLFADPKLIEETANLLRQFPHATAETILDQLDAFLLNQSVNHLTFELKGKFEQKLIQALANVPQSGSLLGKRTANSDNIFNSATKKSVNFDPKSPDSIDKGFDHAEKIAYLEKIRTNTLDENAYNKRVNSGQVVINYTPTLVNNSISDHFEPRSADFPYSIRKPIGKRCDISMEKSDMDCLETKYRHMYTTNEERARALEKHLLHLQKDFCAKMEINEEQMALNFITNNATGTDASSTELQWVCGRIVNSTGHKLHKNAIVIEGSLKHCYGMRMEVDIQELTEQYSLFPGQVIFVLGRIVAQNTKSNQSQVGIQRKIIAQRIIEGVARPLVKSSAQELLDYHHKNKMYLTSQGLRILVAAGPFTTSDNLEYYPLNDLLMLVLKEKPDVLILVGPFVEVSHPLMRDGDIHLPNPDNEEEEREQRAGDYHQATYEMVFIEKIVRDGLRAMYDSESDFGGKPLPTNIILVPSLQDAFHDYVFPQPAFPNNSEQNADIVVTNFFEEPIGKLNIPYCEESEEDVQRVFLMPNPCIFRVNEMTIGVTSNDILFSLSSEEISGNINNNLGYHRMSKLASHLIMQQSFLPYYPALSQQVDYRQSKHWQMKITPDILILPSKLAPMAKEVMGCLVVNPGTCAKGVNGGTFLDITVNPIKEETLEQRLEVVQTSETSPSDSKADWIMIQHDVPLRTVAKISKI